MIVLAGAAALIFVVVLVGLALTLTSLRAAGGGFLLVIGGGAILLLAGAGVLVVGLGTSVDEDDAAPAGRKSTAGTTTRSVGATTTTTTIGGRDAVLETREVVLRAETTDTFVTSPIVDELASRAVLRISLEGFEPDSNGLIEQCSAASCGNSFPVSFGASGAARLQYLVVDKIATARDTRSCGARDDPCVVRVRSNGRAAYVTTVFGGARQRRAVTVDRPEGGFVDGQGVLVSVTGYRPGERVQAMLCAAPATWGETRCGAPGTVAPFIIAPDGSGHTAIVIQRGRVGSAGVVCGRETPCGIVVSSERSFGPNPVVVVKFASGPAAVYDATRLLAGLLLAALLLGAAWFLARTTDWRKPTEADTPELDRAVL